MNQSSKTDKKINVDEEEMRLLNQEMITSDLITPDKIYLDLTLIKDINIGTILSFLKERKPDISHDEYRSLYDQIIQKLPEYNLRQYDDFEHIFSFLNITNQQIKDRKNDPQYASWIIHNSPITKYIDVLKSQLSVNINHSMVIGKKDPIEFTINTYPLQLCKEDEFIVGFYLSNRFKINVRVSYIDLKQITLSSIYQYDEIYTYFLKEILDVEDIRTAYSHLKFIKKRLFAAKLFGDKIIHNKNTDQEGLYIQSRLDILTNFKFVSPHLFSAPPLDKEKEAKQDG